MTENPLPICFIIYPLVLFMKLLGKILISICIFIIFTSFGLWILAKNIKPETLKTLVNNQITALTHKKSEIDGTISWQLFPRPGLKFTQVKIGDEQLNEDYSLAIDTLVLNLKITPLIKGHFIFSEINVDGLKLDIRQNNSPTTPEQVAGKVNDKAQFAIEKLSLNHSKITISNKSSSIIFKNVQMGIEHFNLQNTAFPTQLKARLTQANSVGIAKANINFKGRVTLSPDLNQDLSKGIRSSAIEGQLLIQNILLNQFAINKINTTIKTSKNGINFNPLTLSLYHGQSVGSMTYTHNNQQLSLNQTATNLDGRQLLLALLGNETISGNMDYSIHASMPVNKLSLQYLNGKGTVTLKDGKLYHINLDKIISHLKTKLNILINGIPINLGKSPSFSDWDKNKFGEGNTPFKLANFSYRLDNGNLNSESMLVQTANLQVSGEGSLNLFNHEVSSRLRASVNEDNSDSAMDKVQKALGGYFPLIVSGTMENPSVVPDFKKMNPLLSPLLIKSTIEKPVKIITTPLKDLIN